MDRDGGIGNRRASLGFVAEQDKRPNKCTLLASASTYRALNSIHVLGTDKDIHLLLNHSLNIAIGRVGVRRVRRKGRSESAGGRLGDLGRDACEVQMEDWLAADERLWGLRLEVAEGDEVL